MLQLDDRSNISLVLEEHDVLQGHAMIRAIPTYATSCCNHHRACRNCLTWLSGSNGQSACTAFPVTQMNCAVGLTISGCGSAARPELCTELTALAIAASSPPNSRTTEAVAPGDIPSAASLADFGSAAPATEAESTARSASLSPHWKAFQGVQTATVGMQRLNPNPALKCLKSSRVNTSALGTAQGPGM